MTKTVRFMIIGAVAGLVVGYFIFAKVGGGYINPLNILVPAQGMLDKFAGAVAGIGTIRTNILISGGVGTVAGFLAAVFLGRR